MCLFSYHRGAGFEHHFCSLPNPFSSWFHKAKTFVPNKRRCRTINGQLLFFQNNSGCQKHCESHHLTTKKWSTTKFLYSYVRLLHEHSTLINTHCIQGTCPPSIKCTPLARPPIMLTGRWNLKAQIFSWMVPRRWNMTLALAHTLKTNCQQVIYKLCCQMSFRAYNIQQI